MKRELVIIGAGPGGYEAALRAASYGMDVVLFEENEVGGTCLHKGCIPTKLFYRKAQHLQNIKYQNENGVFTNDITIDLLKVQLEKKGIIEKLSSGIKMGLKKGKVEVIYSKAKFLSQNSVQYTIDDNTEIMEFENCIIATGSSESKSNITGSELDGVVTSKELLELEKVPKTAVIIGGGVIGLEFANILNSMGTEVTVLEYLDGILLGIDSDISKRVKTQMKKQGIEIINNFSVKEITPGLNVKGELKGEEKNFETELVLIATGRVSNISDLSLENAGVTHDGKGVVVDQTFKTSVENIYAIGDVNRKWMLAHAATFQGFKVVDEIKNIKNDTRFEVMPACIFISPELATVGMTEDEAKNRLGKEYGTVKIPFRSNGKALTMGEEEGIYKIVHDQSGKILGATIFGPHASDLIHQIVVIIGCNIKSEELKNLIFAHPTLSEILHSAIAEI